MVSSLMFCAPLPEVQRQVRRQAGLGDKLVQFVEFALNDPESLPGSGYTPFYADSGQHPRRSLAPPDGPDQAVPVALARSGEAAEA